MNWKPFLAVAAIPIVALGAKTLVPVDDAPVVPELATHMGELQRLTHKLALSIDAGNASLVEMYTHESLVQLKKIQAEVPEYEGKPVALLIDRLGYPGYVAMEEAVKNRATDRGQLLPALDLVIQSCNNCHVATQNPFIRITRGTGINPFNQSFAP